MKTKQIKSNPSIYSKCVYFIKKKKKQHTTKLEFKKKSCIFLLTSSQYNRDIPHLTSLTGRYSCFLKN